MGFRDQRANQSMTIILETERLVFRRLLPVHLDDLFALIQNPEDPVPTSPGHLDL